MAQIGRLGDEFKSLRTILIETAEEHEHNALIFGRAPYSQGYWDELAKAREARLSATMIRMEERECI